MTEADINSADGPERESAIASGGNETETGSALPSGERSWRNLLALDADLYRQKNVRLLTPEARVLIHLKLDGAMPVTEAMKLAGVSYRGFYAVLERLKQAGLIGQVKDKDDQRVRKLSLDPSMPIPPDNL